MFKGIKNFFRSLMFWVKKSPEIEPPKTSSPKPEPSNDGQGGTPIEDKPVLVNSGLPRHYEIAFKEIGTKEIRGVNHNPRVLEYHDTTGNFSDDETAWCASFVNFCLIETYWNEEQKLYIYKGKNYKRIPSEMNALARLIGSGKANARSFLTVGSPVAQEDVKAGDIVVFWRGSPSGWQGHVGFVSGFMEKDVKVLGGNQSNAVNISRYSKATVLGYRRV